MQGPSVLSGRGPRTAPYLVAVFEELRRAGFIEGANLTIDWRTYGQNVDLIPEFVAELIKDRVDVIVVTGDLPIRTVQRATTTIPILGLTDDMVGSGLVNSLARPGGNTTGVSILAAAAVGQRSTFNFKAHFPPGFKLEHLLAPGISKT